MTDSMKFGPEWIRNLPSEQFPSSPVNFAPKTQLAEKRYSREEMLYLFDKSKVIAPESLKRHPALYTEDIQVPLALDLNDVKNTDNVDLYSNSGWQTQRPALRSRILTNRSSQSGGTIPNGPITNDMNSVMGSVPISRPIRPSLSSHPSNWNGNASDWGDTSAGGRSNSKYENFGESWRNKSNWRHELDHSNQSAKWNKWRSNGDTGSSERIKRNSWSADNDSKTAVAKTTNHNEDSKMPEWATENTTRMNGSFDVDGSFLQKDHPTPPPPPPTSQPLPAAISSIKPPDKHVVPDTHKSEIVHNQNPLKSEIDHENRLQEVANELVSKLKLDDDLLQPPTLQPMLSVPKTVPAIAPTSSNDFSSLLNFMNPIKTTASHNPYIHNQPLPPPPNLNILRPPPQLQQPPTSFLDEKWYYLDPQGEVQGPFTTLEMSDWYRAGYFSLSLNVRRLSDDVFIPLQELVKLNPNFPFYQQKFPFTNPVQSMVPPQPLNSNSLFSHMSATDATKTADSYLDGQMKMLMEQKQRNQLLMLLQQQVTAASTIPTGFSSVGQTLPMPMTMPMDSTNFLLNLMNQSQVPPMMPQSNLGDNFNPLSYLQQSKEPDMSVNLPHFSLSTPPPAVPPPISTVDLIEKLAKLKAAVPPVVDVPQTLQQPSRLLDSHVDLEKDRQHLHQASAFMFKDEVVPLPPEVPIQPKKDKVKEKAKGVEIEKKPTVEKKSVAKTKPTTVTTEKAKSPVKKKPEIPKPESQKQQVKHKEQVVQSVTSNQKSLTAKAVSSTKKNTEKLKEPKKEVQHAPTKTKKDEQSPPWSKVNSTTVKPLTEILKIEQKEERKRKTENNKKSVPVEVVEEEKSSGWTKLPVNIKNRAMSLKEIQAEQKKIQTHDAKIKQVTSAVQNSVSSNDKKGAWAGTKTAAENLKWAPQGGKPLKVSPAQTSKVTTSVVNSLSSGFWMCSPQNQSVKQEGSKVQKMKDERTELEEWCVKVLLNATGRDTKGVDIPELIKILIDVESASDVRDYVVNFFGDSKGINHFITQFLDRKSKFRQKRFASTNSHLDNLLVPAPALMPNTANKKSKKKIMKKIEPTMLGVRGIAAEGRYNAGDLDFGDDT